MVEIKCKLCDRKLKINEMFWIKTITFTASLSSGNDKIQKNDEKDIFNKFIQYFRNEFMKIAKTSEGENIYCEQCFTNK